MISLAVIRAIKDGKLCRYYSTKHTHNRNKQGLKRTLFNRTLSIYISLSTKGHNKSKVQKQRGNVLISIVMAAWYNSYTHNVFT